MDNILVSVLVSFYKDTKDIIWETLDSLANQKNFDLNKLEVVVVDDGSNVDISHVINKYKTKLPHLNFVKKQHGDRGSVYEYAKEHKLLHGKYFTILDSDDKWHQDMLAYIYIYIGKQNQELPDIVTTNFYRWYPTKNKIKKTPVILVSKTSRINLNKKMHLARTPYSWPIGKFYKTEFFYNIGFEKNYTNDVDRGKNEILFHICPDVVLYYEILKRAKTWIHITKNLAYARQDRKDSFSNQGWSATKVRTWAKTINYLSSVGASCNGFFYSIFDHYTNAYIRYQNEIKLDELRFEKKLKISYLPKILHPICKLFFKIMIKKIGKKVPIKLI